MLDSSSQPADPAGPTVGSELDDALYYLRHDCEPCAERHFEHARGLGATEEMITAVRARAVPRRAGSVAEPPGS